MRTRLLILLAGVAAGPLLASAVSADDQPRFDDLKFDASRTSLTAEAAAVDSDGDGWVDWYERFEGTDPNDPNSYPGAAQLEIVDDRLVLQSTNFPDRLVIVDLATPEVLKTPELAIPALLGMVQDLHAGTASGKMLQTMISEFGKYGGTLPGLDAILSQAEKDSEISKDLGPRVGGIQMGLISDLWVGFNETGGTTIKVTSASTVSPSLTKEPNSITYNFWPNTLNTTKEFVTNVPNSIGGYDSIETYVVNRVTQWSVVHTFDSSGRLVSSQKYDGKGKPVGPPITFTPATTEAPVDTEKDPTTSDSTPTSETTPTTVGDYADPEYVRPQRLSAEEIAERAEFLKSLTSRFGSTIDLPSGPKEKPGISDPAEPECRGAFCVLFTLVEAPDLSNVNGGDPINPSFGPEAPPVTLR